MRSATLIQIGFLVPWLVISISRARATLSDAAPPARSRDALFEGSVALRDEVVGVHPRLFITPAELEGAANHYRHDPAFFTSWMPDAKSKMSAPTPMDQGEKGQGAARTVMQLAILWRVTGDPKYLRDLDAWVPMMESFTPLRVEKIGGTGNRDLTSGTLLCGFATAYDLLKGKTDARMEAALRKVIIGQATQLYADLRGIKNYPYEQNHLTIPVCGLAVAAMATYDECPEAKAWLVFSRHILDRCLKAVSYDGWFFEGVSYWNFTMEYPLLYATALRRTTGEDLFQGQFFGKMSYYLAHLFLPGSRFAFDFADWGPRVNADGKTAQKGYDVPWHTLHTSLSKYVPLHHETTDPLLRTVIEKIVSESGQKPADADRSFALLWGYRPPAPKSADGALSIPPFHYFSDMDVVHWRQNWTDPNATAFAFKSGPPAGHHITELYPLYSEWKPGLGHAHPDAGSFVLFSRGVFLANNTGYSVKRSRWQNTLTVDGVGQGNDGTAWGTWSKMPYETLNRIRMSDVWLGSSVAASTAVFEDAYAPAMKLKEMRRRLILIDGRFMIVADDIRSELAHHYDWYLHTDREPRPAGAGRWTMDNGPARLIVQALGPAPASTRAEPTVVETEMYDKAVSRPQQRGFHLDLSSPAVTDFQFLTAIGIQSADAPENRFAARRISPDQVEMTDGAVTCQAWIGPTNGFAGTFAFVLREDGKMTTIGLSGQRLDTDAGRAEIPGGGQLILHRNPNASGGWIAECDPTLKWTIK